MFRKVRATIALACLPLGAFTCHGHGTLSVNLVPDRVTAAPSIEVLDAQYKRTVNVVERWAKKHKLIREGPGYYTIDTQSCGLIECTRAKLDITLGRGSTPESAKISFVELGRFPRSSKSIELERDLIDMLATELGSNSVH
jgi:hypothetical protein